MSSHYFLELDNIGGESSEGPCLIAKKEGNHYVTERSKCKRASSILTLCLYGNHIYSELNITVVY